MKYYTSFPIKYRPNTFEDIIGQKNIIQSIKNYIKNKKLPHTILFYGQKGVGKTTLARILSKKINYKIHNYEFNILELDAASYNSVENIRNIIDQAKYSPPFGYKIYIIDEVHMLSTSAFNAFLKILEEPPIHVYFILITTEKNKIPETILSRCIIYKFKKISIEEIQFFLKKISIKENIKYDEESLFMIAKNSYGSIRDALYLFDKISSLSNGKIYKKITMEEIGIIDEYYLYKLMNYIIKKDIFKSFILLDYILKKNVFDIENFINELSIYIKNMIFIKNPISYKFFLKKKKIKIKNLYKKQEKYVSLSYLQKALDICGNTILNLNINNNKRLILEITINKLILLN